jgi:hypothetical protein
MNQSQETGFEKSAKSWFGSRFVSWPIASEKGSRADCPTSVPNAFQ